MSPTTQSLKYIPTRQRSAGLDIIRTIACLSVIFCHFFIHTKFNSSVFQGVSMFLQGMASSTAVGSDLYMILTGYLCCNKVFGKNFYLSGIKVIISYLFFSLLTIIVNVYWTKTGMTWETGLLGILKFTTIPYAWYIEMWIGLFILAPFLNIWYKALPNKKMKLTLILILISFSAFPDFFNRLGHYLVPAYWKFMYPLSFYFTGCFIKEYKPKYSRMLLFFIIIGITLISPLITHIGGWLLGWKTFFLFIGSRSGFFIATIAIAIFLICFNLDVSNKWLCNIVKSVSLRSLDIFLGSAILDFFIYPLFIDRYYIDQSQFGIFYFIICPIVFLICYTLASVKRYLFILLDKILSKFNVPFALQSKVNHFRLQSLNFS